MTKMSSMQIACKNIDKQVTRSVCLIGLIAFLSFMLMGSSMLSANLMQGIRHMTYLYIDRSHAEHG